MCKRIVINMSVKVGLFFEIKGSLWYREFMNDRMFTYVLKMLDLYTIFGSLFLLSITINLIYTKLYSETYNSKYT